MIRVMATCFIIFTIFFTAPLWGEEEKAGCISLAFDDGYPSWTAIIAPEIKKAGGTATGFVNNQRVRPGILTFADLRDLQNNYGWEIGTHTYHHFHAPDYVKQKGMAVWLKDELDTALTGLASEGLKAHALAFPFNDSNAAVEKEAMKKVESFRRQNAFPILTNNLRDGSYPSTSFEIASYVPVELMFQWIDFARQQNRCIFLFGHKVLPDEEFLTGKVTSVSERTIGIGTTTGTVNKDAELCLVPDARRRLYGPPIKVISIENGTVTVSRNDMLLVAKEGSPFIIGECYATQLSYFRKLAEYAAGKLPFLTVSQALKKAARH